MTVTTKSERFIKATQVNHSAPGIGQVAKALIRTELTNGVQTWVRWIVWSSVGLYVDRVTSQGFDTRRDALAYLGRDFAQTPAWTTGANWDAPLCATA
jgi:hypothetical protein